MASEDLYHIAHYLDEAYQIMMWKKDEEEWQMYDDELNQKIKEDENRRNNK